MHIQGTGAKLTELWILIHTTACDGTKVPQEIYTLLEKAEGAYQTHNDAVCLIYIRQAYAALDRVTEVQ